MSCMEDGTTLAPKQLFEYLASSDVFKGRIVTERDRSTPNAKFVMIELDPLLDSTQMTSNDWNLLGMLIDSRLTGDHPYAGVVVIHGTDSMAFTASALTFMLFGQQYPVVITGSQSPLRPVGEQLLGSTDAWANLTGALALAQNRMLHETVIYFHNKVILGSRAVKQHSVNYDAFHSPNVGVLGFYNGKFEYNENLLELIGSVRNDEVKAAETAVANGSSKAFGMKILYDKDHNTLLQRFHSTAHVILYQTRPGNAAGEDAGDLETLINSKKDDESIPVGIVVLSYGAGNAQGNIKNILKKAREEYFMPVVYSSQCFGGAAHGTYSVRLEADHGVNVYDMTTESAFTRLLLAMSQFAFRYPNFSRREAFRRAVETWMGVPYRSCFNSPTGNSVRNRDWACLAGALHDSTVAMYTS